MIDRLTASVRPQDGLATVRVEDVYDTGIDDLWGAIARPERLARWIAEVQGDLRVGGAFRIRFTSGWEGGGRVEICDAPGYLQVVTREDDGGTETVIDAVLTAVGDRTRLVVEDRGLPAAEAPDHAAGWQVHLEDLAASISGRPVSDWADRWRELRPAYRGA